MEVLDFEDKLAEVEQQLNYYLLLIFDGQGFVDGSTLCFSFLFSYMFYLIKIPHTEDTESLDMCGQQQD